MNSTAERPLSPHITVYKWGAGMTVSILHRVTGGAITVAGLAVLAWWLISIAGGDAEYGKFVKIAQTPEGMIVLVGLTWAFFQHLLSGVRHLVLDTGAGYELKVNRFWAIMTLVGSLFATAATWYFLAGVGK
jgi:succinate dehydrogenase / fumarate reductase, cytochrome b subunit